MTEWQPIETAPENEEILVGCWVFNDWARWSCWLIWDASTNDFGCDGEFGDEPTHWMPLPEPPKKP